MNEISECGELEEPKYFAARANVGKSAPGYTRNPSRRPRFPLLRQGRCRPKEHINRSCHATVIRGHRAIESYCHLAGGLSGADASLGRGNMFVARQLSGQETWFGSCTGTYQCRISVQELKYCICARRMARLYPIGVVTGLHNLFLLQAGCARCSLDRNTIHALGKNAEAELERGGEDAGYYVVVVGFGDFCFIETAGV
jgi:hypothetical protein